MSTPDHVPEALQADFSLQEPGFLENPYPYYERLRQQGPVIWVEGVRPVDSAWWMTNYDHILPAMKDARRFGRQMKLPPGATPPQVPDPIRPIFQMMGQWMLNTEPPDHTRLRGLVSKAFTPKMVEQLRPNIEAITARLLDGMQERGEGDLIHDFAYPLPVMVIAALLGFPLDETDRLRDLSSAIAKAIDYSRTQEDLVRASGAAVELAGMIREVLAERRREPKDDLLTGLLQASEEGQRLSEQEVVASAVLLLLAGHETTTNLIGNGLLALLAHPDQLHLLRQEPSLTENAVEEFLRYDSPVQQAMRFAYEDVEIAGVPVRAGQKVVMVLGAANRDPIRFPEPERLDIRRPNADRHLSFGMGLHFCLGAPLARMEGQIAIGRLLERFPRMEQVSVTRRPFVSLRGLETFHVRC